MAGKPTDNERKACDAVMRSLEQLSAAKRSNAHSPEDDKIGPPIEYVFDLSKKIYAMEHTIVEAFSDQIETDVHFEAFVGPITEALDGRLPPPGTYHLYFPIHPSKGMRPKDIRRVQGAIIAWVMEAAAALHGECPEQPSRDHRPRGYNNSFRETVGGVELLLRYETGWWKLAEAKGRLFVMRFAPKDYEALRPVRLKQAMNKKLPKLELWKKKGAPLRAGT